MTGRGQPSQWEPTGEQPALLTPLSLPFFSILVGIFVGLVALVEFGVVSYTYTRVGLRPRPALWLLFASLLGSYFNIPVARLPGEQILTNQTVNFSGVDYAVPAVVAWPAP
jgi:uncharacterized membrane protein